MYKNPRLKHVEKIRDLAAAMPYSSFTNEILYQCNLLLETKKKIKSTNEHLIPTDKIFLRYDMFSKGWVAGREDLLKWLETWIKSDLHRSIDAFVFTEMEKIKKELKQNELIK